MDTLVLIEYLIALADLHEAMAPISEQLLKKVLIPSIQWKVGKPQIKIRKAGVINILALIEKKIINEEQLLDSFNNKQFFGPPTSTNASKLDHLRKEKKFFTKDLS